LFSDVERLKAVLRDKNFHRVRLKETFLAWHKYVRDLNAERSKVMVEPLFSHV
jgi:hypothetical protein